MIAQALSAQAGKIKNNKLVFALMVVVSITVICFAIHHDAGAGHKALVQSVAYLFAMWLCSVCIDMYAAWKPTKYTLAVRQPVQEAIVATSFFLLGGIGLLVRFMNDAAWGHMSIAQRLPPAIAILGLMYPVGITIYLLVKRYRLGDLGIRLTGFVPAIVVLGVTAGASLLAAPGHITWNAILQEAGGSVVGALVMGFVTAGLTEELWRMILQTRLGAAMKNTGMGWFVASLLWALLHGPKWWSENHDLSETILSCLRIVPLGLMWGYLTHRTKSILPSILIHGLNVWGLQNF